MSEERKFPPIVIRLRRGRYFTYGEGNLRHRSYYSKGKVSNEVNTSAIYTPDKKRLDALEDRIYFEEVVEVEKDEKELAKTILNDTKLATDLYYPVKAIEIVAGKVQSGYEVRKRVLEALLKTLEEDGI